MTHNLTANESLLLELPVPFKLEDGELWMEAQAFNGITQWLSNFDQMTICAPVIPVHLIDPTYPWKKVDDLPCRDRLQVVKLPWGYHPRDHFRSRKQVAKIFEKLIPEHRYLVFASLGWLGAWGSIAAHQATRSQRPFAVWLDWVLHEMPHAPEKSIAKRAWGRLSRSMSKRESLNSIRNAKLGLFNGRSVYEGYAPYCENPQVVHDIHLKADDVISQEALQARIDANHLKPLHIVYVGRVESMKGPMEWIDTIERVVKEAPEGAIQATWMGGGTMLEACRQAVTQTGLDDLVKFPGGESDRPKVLGFLRASDVFLQCHLTPESPRCLIEALMSGLPIVGFESAYAIDLVAHSQKAGLFSALQDTAGLAKMLKELCTDKDRLAEMAKAAVACGAQFSDAAVFKHRSDLIKRYL